MAKPRVTCTEHDLEAWAIVCQHHLERGRKVGFVENSSDPDDLQAWCDLCEAKFLEEGNKTPAFRALNKACAVCLECYAGIKRRHSRPTPQPKPRRGPQPPRRPRRRARPTRR